VKLFTKDDRYHPFSNGTEYRCWLESNCERGKGGCRHYRPNATSSRHGCTIEVAVALAGFRDDGSIPMRIALRGGWVEPGPNGSLVECQSAQYPGARLIPACPEYKGRDEPDDRPRRGPKPPADQLDIFDPRHQPAETETKRPAGGVG
jgi:hypothetical protein